MADLLAIDPEPVEKDVAAFLEFHLKEARGGAYSAVAIAFVYRDGSTGSGNSQQHNLASMVGAVASLQAKLVRDMIE